MNEEQGPKYVLSLCLTYRVPGSKKAVARAPGLGIEESSVATTGSMNLSLNELNQRKGSETDATTHGKLNT